MEWLANKLTSCLLRHDVIDEAEQELYCFGFQSGLEMVACHLAILAVAAYLHRIPEYLLFSLVFVPIRSFAGGLHLPKFSQCFICSCAVVAVVVFLSEKLELSSPISAAATAVMLFILFLLRPVDHENRPVDEDEQHFFSYKLRRAILGIGILTAVLYLTGLNHYLVLVMLTLASAIISMFVGKWLQYRRRGIRAQIAEDD